MFYISEQKFYKPYSIQNFYERLEHWIIFAISSSLVFLVLVGDSFCLLDKIWKCKIQKSETHKKKIEWYHI